MRSGDMIRILPASLVETDAGRADEFRRLSARLDVALGWHYLLDLVFASREVEAAPLAGARALDAGAGVGLMQWWLADRGADVVSVDRDARYVTRRMRNWCHVRSLSGGSQASLGRAAASRIARAGLLRAWRRWPRKAVSLARDLLERPAAPPAHRGTVWLHEGDLTGLSAVPSASVDTVVSISALEHNPPDRLPAVVRELERVLKPEGRLVATLGAARDRDWFHEPSKGWRYTEPTLRRAFGLAADAPSHYAEHDALLEALRGHERLRRDFARFYFESGANGMPWGRWDPQYQPVGVVKVKRT